MKTDPPTLWRRLSRYAARIVKSHPLACLSVGLTVALVPATVLLLAQRVRADEPAADTLAVALTLYEQGAFREAQPLFAAVGSTDPNYDIAQAYDALCRYEVSRADATEDYRWFLDALKSPALQQASLPAELREDLTFKQIDAHYHSRPFGVAEIIPLAAAFRQDYPTSARLPAVSEYELAAAFEAGMARVYGASLDEHKRFHRAWTDGLARLQQFLSRVNDFPANEYTVLQDRSLAEDLQLSLAVLGQDLTALADVPVQDVVARQRYGLMLVGLHQKLHPELWEQNLQMVTNCQAALQTWPASRDRARLVRHLAEFGFRTGERFCAEAAGTPPEDAQTIAVKRAVASQYFQAARAVQQQLVEQDWTRTSLTDMALVWVALFNSYYSERDFDGLMAVTATQLTNSVSGSPNWLAAKLYQGVALSEQSAAQPEAAAAAFEAVMAYGFEGVQKNAVHDHVVLSAARWRIRLALKTDDPAAALSVVQWVEQGNGVPRLKEKFLEDHAWVATWAETN